MKGYENIDRNILSHARKIVELDDTGYHWLKGQFKLDIRKYTFLQGPVN